MQCIVFGGTKVILFRFHLPRLIDELAKANEQANMILQEQVARPAGGVKKKTVVPPKPKSFAYSDDDWYSSYLRKDAGTQISAVAKRALAQKKK